MRTASSAYSLTLEWQEPIGEYDHFEIDYVPPDGIAAENLPLIVEPTPEPSITLEDLMAYTKYDVTVVAVSGLRRSIAAQDSIFTSKMIGLLFVHNVYCVCHKWVQKSALIYTV